jgi:undecaprenyl-diphosphatase
MRFPISARRSRPPSLGQSLTLGLLHGPAELVPISSSGHITLLPWLLGWDHSDQDPELRKGLEVALHAGAAAALVVDARHELFHHVDRRYAAFVAISSIPPALAGLMFKARIERRLGTAPTIAAGLIAGGLTMLQADRAPEARRAGDAGVGDALWLGLAQASALVPGVSRSGATLAAARLRQFTRADAARLSHDVGLPVIVGAAGLQAVGLARQRLDPGWRAALAVGAGSALGSTLIATRVIRPDAGRRLSGWAAYRLALAGLILVRLRA